MQSSARGAAREFAFHGREDTFNQGAFSVLFCGEVLAHLEARPGCSAIGTAFCRDDALSLELLAAEGVVAFRVELGVGQHATDGSKLVCLAYQDRQSGAVVPRRLTGPLSQDDLPFYIDHGEPLQPMLPGALLLAEMLHTADEIAAYRGLRQSGCIDGYRGKTSLPPWHAPHDLVHHASHIVRLKPRQKSIQRGVVGNRVQSHRGS